MKNVYLKKVSNKFFLKSAKCQPSHPPSLIYYHILLFLFKFYLLASVVFQTIHFFALLSQGYIFPGIFYLCSSDMVQI